MPTRFKLPTLIDNQPLDTALKLMRTTGVHAVVVNRKRGSLRIFTSKDILQAKAGGLQSLDQIRSNGLAVTKPALSPGKFSKRLSDVRRMPKPFGRSRSRFDLMETVESHTTLRASTLVWRGSWGLRWLHGSGSSSAATITGDLTLTPLLKKIKSIRQYGLS